MAQPLEYEAAGVEQRAPKVRRPGQVAVEDIFVDDPKTQRRIMEEAILQKQAKGAAYMADYLDRNRAGVGRGQLNAQPVKTSRGNLGEIRLPSMVAIDDGVDDDGLSAIYGKRRAIEEGRPGVKAAGRTIANLYEGLPTRGGSDEARRQAFLAQVARGEGFPGGERELMGGSPEENPAARALQAPVMKAIYGAGDPSVLNQPIGGLRGSAASEGAGAVGGGLAPAALVPGDGQFAVAATDPLMDQARQMLPRVGEALAVTPAAPAGQLGIPGMEAMIAPSGPKIAAIPDDDRLMAAQDFARGGFDEANTGVSVGTLEQLARKQARAIEVPVDPKTMLPTSPENLDWAIEALQKKALNVDSTNSAGFDPAEMRSTESREYKNRQMDVLPANAGELGPWVGKQGEPALLYPAASTVATGNTVPKTGPSGLEMVDEVTSLKKMAQDLRNETRRPIIGQEQLNDLLGKGEAIDWTALSQLGLLSEKQRESRNPPVAAILDKAGEGGMKVKEFLYQRLGEDREPVPGEFRVGGSYGYDTDAQVAGMREILQKAGIPIKTVPVLAPNGKRVNATELMWMSDNPRYQVRVPGMEEAVPAEWLGRLAVSGLSSDVRTRKPNLPSKLLVQDARTGEVTPLKQVYDASGTRPVGYSRNTEEMVVQGPKLLGSYNQRRAAEKELGISGAGVQALINTLTAAGDDGSYDAPMGKVPVIETNPELKQASQQLYRGEKPRTPVYFANPSTADEGLRAVADSTGVPLAEVMKALDYNVAEYGPIKPAPEKARINAAITQGVDRAAREGNIIERIANEARRQGKGSVDLRRVRTGGVPTLTTESRTPLYEQAAIAGLPDMVPSVSMPSSFSPIRRMVRR